MWPKPSQCAACHDGVIQQRVTWQPRTGPPTGNLRFTHERHARAVTAKNPADSALGRQLLRVPQRAWRAADGRPQRRRRTVPDCHGFTEPHFDVPSEACATCHVPLTEAPGLTRRTSRTSRGRGRTRRPDFLLGGHGKEAKGAGNPGPHGGRGQLRDMPRAELLRRLSCQRAGVPGIQRARGGRALAGVRGDAAGPPSHGRPRFSARMAATRSVRRDVRRVSCARELHELPRRGAAARDRRAASRGPGRGRGRAVHASAAGRATRASSGNGTDRRRARAATARPAMSRDVSRVSPPRRHATGRLPPAALPDAASELRVRSRGELQRLPQPCAVLPELPSAVGARRDVAARHGRLPRRVSRVQPRARAGGATESRVVRRVSCGARLHGVSFRRGRRVPIQPSRAGLQRDADAVEEPIVMHRMSRERRFREAGDRRTSYFKGSDPLETRPRTSARIFSTTGWLAPP